MARQFTPCKGRDACRDGDDGCLTCNRSWSEIQQTQEAVNGVVALIQDQEYENLDDLFDYIARKVRRKLEHAKSA